MLTLAIETSTVLASVALLDDRELVAAESYRLKPRSQEGVLDIIAEMLARQGVDCARIGRYVVGRGPGNYTGMRISFAMAQALALPGGCPVIAVSSGAAVARELLAESDAARAVVIGDARRGRYWVGAYTLANGMIATELDWRLCDVDELRRQLGDKGAVASPDMERLLGKLPLGEWIGDRLVAEDRYPRAQTLAEIAMDRIEHGVEPEPLEPLYMHPPV